MHGRLKVRSTKEQEEAKRLEREKKLKAYQSCMNLLFKKIQSGEHDQEALDVSGQILVANPDVYTLWNLRKKVFQEWQKTVPADELQKVSERELTFLEQCLATNPKSYGSWHHRCWVIDLMPKPDLDRELALCAKLLDKDERNFHGWDYRRFVAKKASISAENEIQYTTEKISANFSNFSSWHYRSKLLPVVYADTDSVIGVTEEVLQKELRLVENAVFTDPSDQSAWFYMRWLMGQGYAAVRMLGAHFSGDTLSVLFSSHVNVPKDVHVKVLVSDSEVNVEWRAVFSHKHSSLWVAEKLACIEGLSISVVIENSPPVTLNIDASGSEALWVATGVTKFDSVQHSKMRTMWLEELASCQQLLELEPDNKWVITTVLSLMTLLDPVTHEADITRLWDHLVFIDPARTNYYRQQKEKYIVQKSLCLIRPESRSLTLAGLQLKTVAFVDHMFYLTDLDLSNNELTSLSGFSALRCCRQLNLNHNRLSTLTGLCDMPELEELLVLHNNIEDKPDIACLRGCFRCPQLKILLLDGNPLTREITCKQQCDLLTGFFNLIRLAE